MLAESVTVQIPSDLMQFGFDRREIQRRVSEWLVLSLFVEGKISSGKAAKILRMGRVEFFTFLKQRGLSYINFTTEELTEELDAVQQLEVGRRE